MKRKLPSQTLASLVLFFSVTLAGSVSAQGFPGAPMTRPPQRRAAQTSASQPVSKPQANRLVAAPVTSEQPQDPKNIRPKVGKSPDTDEASAKDEDENDRGFYFRLFGAALFSPTGSSHGWAETCPSLPSISWNPNCTTVAPIGGAIGARLGFRYKFIGIEAFGLGAGDWSSASFDQPVPGIPSIASSMQVGRVGGGPGGGLRLLSAPGTFRVSAGLGAGVLFRYVFTSFSSLDGSSTNYKAPFLVSDINVMVGPLSLGLFALFEFSKDINIRTNIAEQVGAPAEVDQVLSPIGVFSGTQFFLGPVLALHFGN